MLPFVCSVVVFQVGRTPKLLVWDTISLVTLTELVGHYGGVSHCCFQPNADSGEGKLVASVGLDVDHSLIIHDWRTGAVVASAKGLPAKTLDISWSPTVRRLVFALYSFGMRSRRGVGRGLVRPCLGGPHPTTSDAVLQYHSEVNLCVGNVCTVVVSVC